MYPSRTKSKKNHPIWLIRSCASCREDNNWCKFLDMYGTERLTSIKFMVILKKTQHDSCGNLHSWAKDFIELKLSFTAIVVFFFLLSFSLLRMWCVLPFPGYLTVSQISYAFYSPFFYTWKTVDKPNTIEWLVFLWSQYSSFTYMLSIITGHYRVFLLLS